MQDKKQEIKPSAPKGPMKTSDLQRNMRSLPTINKFFNDYHIRGKRVEEIATGLGKYNRDLDPKDKLELKKSLEKTMKNDSSSEKRTEAANLLKFYRDQGAIDP